MRVASKKLARLSSSPAGLLFDGNAELKRPMASLMNCMPLRATMSTTQARWRQSSLLPPRGAVPQAMLISRTACRSSAFQLSRRVTTQ